jgi:hypothetical protein
MNVETKRSAGFVMVHRELDNLLELHYTFSLFFTLIIQFHERQNNPSYPYILAFGTGHRPGIFLFLPFSRPVPVFSRYPEKLSTNYKL